MRISDWSSDVCSSDLQRRSHPYQLQRIGQIPSENQGIAMWIKTQNNPGKEIIPGGFAMNIGRLRMRSIRVGIRHRLYLAVGAIASFALISAADGWFALTRLDRKRVV